MTDVAETSVCRAERTTADDLGEKVDEVRARLLAWFRENARDLPWRHTRDPYAVLVSEVMLQQTQVDRVIPYYLAFLERFPTVEDLAVAPTAEVIQMWAGLGYNRRAVNLQRTAQAVVDQHGGVFPPEPAALRALPGIGPYTAGAVACFAFEQDVPFIDTNMRRVLHRLFAGAEGEADELSDRQILEIAAALVPPGDGWAWNQGLIEFGALQCTARKPACVVCPLQQQCAAFPDIQSMIKLRPTGRKKGGAPFEGSNRFYRGRILSALRDAHASDTAAGIPLATLGPLVRESYGPDDEAWLRALVDGLARDGLAAVAEERAAYDAATEEHRDGGAVTVSLP